VDESHALEQARRALDRHDWQACCDLAQERQYSNPATEAERLDLLAESTWWLGRLEESIAARRQAYQLHRELGETRRAGMCAVWLYQDHCLRGRTAAASGWLQRARRALDRDTGCVEHGALLLREAEVAHGEGRLDDATTLAERARELGRTLAAPDLEAEALQTLGRVLIDAGRPAAGLVHLDEAMLLATEGSLGPYSTGKVYCSLISACEELGDLRRAAEWTEATATWATQHPLAIFPGICRVHRAVVLERRGALVDAEREAARACTELLGSHLPNAAAAFAEVGDIRRRLGDLDRAEDAFGRAEELCGSPCAGTALLRLAQGRLDAARRIIAVCLSTQPSQRLGRARILPASVQIAVAAQDLENAQESTAELESIAVTFDTPMLHAMARLARGRVQLAENDPGAAVNTLHDALRRWQALDVPYEVATTATLIGQALRETGDDEGATASFSRARALFEQIGARLDARDVDAAHTTRRPAGLTERETEVLRLIAAGRTNKEVAAELRLSPKTVSRHLTNIFTKIDVSSRAAATAFAFEHHLIGPAHSSDASGIRSRTSAD
jgi:DNA-binding CsgD family transcriptional regulator